MPDNKSMKATGEAVVEAVQGRMVMPEALVASAKRAFDAVTTEAQSLLDRFQRDPVRTAAPFVLAAAARSGGP